MLALTLNVMFLLLGSLLRLLVSPANLRDIALENVALRQQLAVFKRKGPAASAAWDGSLLLGLAVPELEGLAPGVDHRQTRDGRGLASEGFSPVLDLEVQAEMRTPSSQPCDQGSDPQDGRC